MKLPFTLLLWLLSLIAFGQKKNDSQTLHFLSSNPDMGLDYTYLTAFYKYQSDSLISIDTLNSGKTTMVKRVMFYPFLNKMFIQEDDYKNVDNKLAYFIDATTLKISSDTIPFDQLYYRPIAFSKPVFSVVLGTNHSKIQNIYTVLMEGFSSKDIKANDFQNFICSGHVGGPIKNGDAFGLVYDTLDSKIKIAKTFKIEDRPIFNYQMTNYLVKPKGRYISAIVKNDKWVVLDIDPEGKENLTTYHIQSTNKDNEHTLDIEGDQTRTRSFNNWLAGSIAQSNPEGKKLSPGTKYRKKEADNYGPPYDIMTKVLELYYPGKLFLYHMSSRQYIEWATLENGDPQGDSEIILVEDETVYYRINDKIYQAEIVNSKELGESKLLVQDDRVRDIHWAFFSE